MTTPAVLSTLSYSFIHNISSDAALCWEECHVTKCHRPCAADMRSNKPCVLAPLSPEPLTLDRGTPNPKARHT
eukprot:365040-Chlamydomonas_euryale.AAC.4